MMLRFLLRSYTLENTSNTKKTSTTTEFLRHVKQAKKMSPPSNRHREKTSPGMSTEKKHQREWAASTKQECVFELTQGKLKRNPETRTPHSRLLKTCGLPQRDTPGLCLPWALRIPETLKSCCRWLAGWAGWLGCCRPLLAACGLAPGFLQPPPRQQHSQ